MKDARSDRKAKVRHLLVVAAIATALLVGCNTTQDPSDPASSPADPSSPAPGAPPPELAFAPVDAVVPAPPPPAGGAESELRMGVAAATQPVVVYLHKSGRRYSPGGDDARAGVSSVLSYYKLGPVDFPAATLDDAQWAELLTRVRAYFSRYNVAITDARPASGTYTEVAVGATNGTFLGLSTNTTGIAPLGSCRVVPGAVGFVFHELFTGPYGAWYGGIAGAAETIAHEIGHTLSLSHEQLDQDLMSYAAASASKDFQDAPSACGTSPTAVESCSCGGATQNSRQQLFTMVGAKPASPPPPPPPSGDTKPPVVAIASPAEGASIAGNQILEVSVDATDDVGVASVQLYWEYSDRLLACDDSAGFATCARSGARSTWRINVGTGARAFYAVAKDAAGNTAQTPRRSITLTAPAAPPPTPPVDAPPVVTADLPTSNAILARGSTIVFRARAGDDKGLADVRAVWGYPGGSLEYTMSTTSASGVYEAQTTVSASATPGKRTVWFTATDNAGQKSTSTAVDVWVQ